MTLYSSLSLDFKMFLNETVYNIIDFCDEEDQETLEF